MSERNEEKETKRHTSRLMSPELSRSYTMNVSLYFCTSDSVASGFDLEEVRRCQEERGQVEGEV